MKICIFADVHGNIDTFNKMIEREYDAVDYFIFAGDIFGYFYGQKEIIDRFMSMRNLVAIKGNHEKYYLTGEKIESLTDRYGSSYKMSLSDEQLKYIKGLSNKAEIKVGGKRIGIFHGGPSDFLEQRLYPNALDEINRAIDDLDYDYVILGHTHYQLLYQTKEMVVINPGSLGQPRDGKGFSYCLLDTETGNCTYKTVEVIMSALLKLVEKYDADKYVFKYLQKKYIQKEK